MLERADLVGKTRRGREQLVHIDIEAVRRARQLLDEFEDVWHHRLDRFESLFDETTTYRKDTT